MNRKKIMVHQKITIHSVHYEDTLSISKDFGRLLHPNDVVALCGDLGSGKTVFTQGLSVGLGIGEPIPSPTFTILIEHANAAIPLYHFDAYRLSSEEDFRSLGFEEYFDANGVCVVEWAERIKGVFPLRTIHIDIRKDLLDESYNRRNILFRFPAGDNRINYLKKQYLMNEVK